MIVVAPCGLERLPETKGRFVHAALRGDGSLAWHLEQECPDMRSTDEEHAGDPS